MKDINEYLQQLDKVVTPIYLEAEASIAEHLHLRLRSLFKQALTERDAEFLTILEGLEMESHERDLFEADGMRQYWNGYNTAVNNANHKIALIKQQLQVKEEQ